MRLEYVTVCPFEYLSPASESGANPHRIDGDISPRARRSSQPANGPRTPPFRSKRLLFPGLPTSWIKLRGSAHSVVPGSGYAPHESKGGECFGWARVEYGDLSKFRDSVRLVAGQCRGPVKADGGSCRYRSEFSHREAPTNADPDGKAFASPFDSVSVLSWRRG